MKFTPVSADLLIKLGVGVVAVLAVAYAVSKLKGVAGEAAGAAVQAVGDVAWAVSPANNENVIYQTANRITGGTDDLPLGVRIYNFFHPNE